MQCNLFNPPRAAIIVGCRDVYVHALFLRDGKFLVLFEPMTGSVSTETIRIQTAPIEDVQFITPLPWSEDTRKHGTLKADAEYENRKQMDEWRAANGKPLARAGDVGIYCPGCTRKLGLLDGLRPCATCRTQLCSSCLAPENWKCQSCIAKADAGAGESQNVLKGDTSAPPPVASGDEVQAEGTSH